MNIIGPTLEIFDKVSDILVPNENDFKDNIFITKSYDAQIHFEDDMENVFEIYEKITGQKLELDTDI